MMVDKLDREHAGLSERWMICMSNFAAPDPIFRVCVSGGLLSEMATQVAEGFEKPAREIILSVLAVGR